MVEIPKITLNMLKHTRQDHPKRLHFICSNKFPRNQTSPPFPKQPYESTVTLPKKNWFGCVLWGSPVPSRVEIPMDLDPTSWPLSSAFQGRDFNGQGRDFGGALSMVSMG